MGQQRASVRFFESEMILSVLNLAKSLERRMWFTDHPLLQVPIHRDVLARIVVGLLLVTDVEMPLVAGRPAGHGRRRDQRLLGPAGPRTRREAPGAHGRHYDTLPRRFPTTR